MRDAIGQPIREGDIVHWSAGNAYAGGWQGKVLGFTEKRVRVALLGDLRSRRERQEHADKLTEEGKPVPAWMARSLRTKMGRPLIPKNILVITDNVARLEEQGVDVSRFKW